MKRKGIIYFVFVVLFFAGCMDNVESPTVPLNEMLYQANVSQAIEEKNIIPVIIKSDKYTDIFLENYHNLPTRMYFINFILSCIKQDQIQFDNCRDMIRFKEQLEAISVSYTMSGGKNLQGIKTRIEKLSIPEIDSDMNNVVLYLMIKMLTPELLDHVGDIFIETTLTDWNSAIAYFSIPEAELGWIGIAIIVAGTALILRGIWWVSDCNICNLCFNNAESKAETNGITLEEAIQDCFDSSACRDCF